MNKNFMQIMLLILLLPNVIQAQLQFLDVEEKKFDAGRIFKAEVKGLKSNCRTDKFLFDFSTNGLLSYWFNYGDTCRYLSQAYLKLPSSRFPINTSEVMTRYHLKMYDAQRNSIPSLKCSRVASQVIFGSIGGIVGIVGSIGIGRLLSAGNQSGPERHDDAEHRGMAVILSIGSTLGSAMTVYGIGTIGDQTGSFWATLGGSIVGGLIQYSVLSTNSETPIQFATFPLQAALATLAFNWTRRWDKDTHSRELMRIKTDKWRADLLSLNLIPVFSSGDKIGWQLNLVNITF